MFVISAALSATGLTERIGSLIARAAGSSEWRAILVIMPAVAALAALSHHLMVTAMMLPILMRLAREQKLPASRLLMPMSLAASLGTTLTLFSAPAFLLANNLLEKQGKAGARTSSAITPIGIALVLLGVVYMSLGRWLLPRRGARTDETDYLRLDRYYTELIVEPESPWIGKPLDGVSGAYQGPPGDRRLAARTACRFAANRFREPLQEGDVFLVRASPDEIASIKDEPGLALHAIAKYGDAAQERPEGQRAHEANQLVQVVVAPHSPFVGRTIGRIDFLKTLGVVVVGLWRREGWHARGDLPGAAARRRSAGALGRAAPFRRARRPSRLSDDGAVRGEGASAASRRARHRHRRRQSSLPRRPTSCPTQLAFLAGAVLH